LADMVSFVLSYWCCGSRLLWTVMAFGSSLDFGCVGDLYWRCKGGGLLEEARSDHSMRPTADGRRSTV
jgi:hypothetical protein